MRQRIIVFVTVLIVVAVLVVLNAATYVTEEKKRDSEFAPNRSTYHSGPTGVRAFYDFLNESGYRVMRWREPTDKLLGPNGQDVQTFVIIGQTQMPFEEEQAKSLLAWISAGGRLVIVDRVPQPELVPASQGWMIDTELSGFSGFSADPANAQAMTEGVSPMPPIQPAPLTRDIDSVMPSRLASKIRLFNSTKQSDSDETEMAEPSEGQANGGSLTQHMSPAPVVYLGNDEGAILIDYPHGRGRIVLLSDPYVVANNGISLKDNLQLALNLVTTSKGLTAFDEFHQGRGVTQNALVAYFSGTPVLAIFLQLSLVILLIIWTRGRRFARPLPLPQIDRRSKLEFVASMAELQERSRAFDLAIENIYSRTRRVLARYAGVDYNSPRSEIATRVASRSNLDRHQLETLMRQCEETINGSAINWRQSIDLVRRLRDVERALGLRMRSRDIRQAAENI
ncbi:MAG TPA: DUF4350 domain-containing protein [Pyrinomonadaceae bacterium]|nr:DUF4350 domain-containing protein [Pyrinomonadaceae bacterium]